MTSEGGVSRRRTMAYGAATFGIGIAGLSACTPGHGARPAPAVRFDANKLRASWSALSQRAATGVLGLGVCGLGGEGLWVSSPDTPFPMQSVFKAPLAATALSMADAGHLSLNETMRVRPQDLAPPGGPLGEAVRTRGEPVTITLGALIGLAVQQSDNSAADLVMGRVGGPYAVTSFLRAHGVNAMRIDSYEREAQPRFLGLEGFDPAWNDPVALRRASDSVPTLQREAAVRDYLDDPRDTTSLESALAFLDVLATGRLLSRRSTDLLLRLMTESPTGPRRLRAGLPPGARLAHKTGTSGTLLGLNGATNDIGVATLADGRRFCIAAMLAGSTATENDREALLADCARSAVSSLA